MKDYKRLTMHLGGGVTLNCKECELNENIRFCTDEECITVLKNRLAELEDKIENGTLKFMPCNVDEMLYEVIKGMPIQEWKVESISFNRTNPKGVIWAQRTSDFAHWKFWVEDCGTKWFATKAEAEVKVRELKGERQ